MWVSGFFVKRSLFKNNVILLNIMMIVIQTFRYYDYKHVA